MNNIKKPNMNNIDKPNMTEIDKPKKRNYKKVESPELIKIRLTYLGKLYCAAKEAREEAEIELQNQISMLATYPVGKDIAPHLADTRAYVRAQLRTTRLLIDELEAAIKSTRSLIGFE